MTPYFDPKTRLAPPPVGDFYLLFCEEQSFLCLTCFYARTVNVFPYFSPLPFTFPPPFSLFILFFLVADTVLLLDWKIQLDGPPAHYSVWLWVCPRTNLLQWCMFTCVNNSISHMWTQVTCDVTHVKMCPVWARPICEHVPMWAHVNMHQMWKHVNIVPNVNMCPILTRATCFTRWNLCHVWNMCHMWTDVNKGHMGHGLIFATCENVPKLLNLSKISPNWFRTPQYPFNE